MLEITNVGGFGVIAVGGFSMSRRPVKVKFVECIECPYYKLIPLEMCIKCPYFGGFCGFKEIRCKR